MHMFALYHLYVPTLAINHVNLKPFLNSALLNNLIICNVVVYEGLKPKRLFSSSVFPWVKAFRITPEFRILRLKYNNKKKNNKEAFFISLI